MSSDQPVPTPSRFAVVGVGASAGGLSALLGLLEPLPRDCGMAFVVLLHLPDMDAESILPILARGTSMPVVLLSEPAALKPDHLYLVPQRHVLAADGASLRCLPPLSHSDPRTSIDQFFRCLADTFAERCVGVLLSGTRSEGVVGLSHIREQGGVTIAQTPEDADHDGLPRAAIASGAVDLILPVGEMAGQLVRFRNGAGGGGLSPDEAAVMEVMEILRIRTRHEFGHYRRASVLRRIERRLLLNGVPDLPSYCDFLRSHDEEAPLLLQDMLISVTSFFRDPSAMDALGRSVLRNLLQSQPRDQPIRIWAVGCATGEEAYSVSIQMHELAAATGTNPDFQIFATDIDERALAVARSGSYPAAVANDVSAPRLAAFFIHEEHQYRVNPWIRSSVLVTSHNVLHDPPFSRVDLILCRNLLIYLDRDAQAAVLRTFRQALNPGGHLFLGMSETAESGAADGAFTAVDEENRIYVASPAFENIVHRDGASSAAMETSDAAHCDATRELAAKEQELQSLKEELIVMNRELKAKVDETARFSDDLQNLVAAGSVVALFVDRGMNISRYTPCAAVLLGLGPTGCGRRLGEVARQLGQATLEDDAAESMRTLQPTERRVHGNDGRVYLARMQPYQTLRDGIDGVVLCLFDVTSLQRTEDESRDAAEVLRLVLESAADLAAVRLNPQGRIASWNGGATSLLGYEEQEMLGQPFEVLADAEERDRGTTEELFRLAREQGSARREQRFRRKDGICLAGSCVITALHQDPAQGFVMAIRDLSEVRRVQSMGEQLSTRERTLASRLSAARRRQDELLHALAGELKRPLNLVQVNAEMLLRLPETRAIAVAGKIAGSIGKAVASQSQIIDGLRDLSLARSGKLTLEMRSADLRGLVEDVVNTTQQQAAAKSLAMSFSCDRDPLVVLCDPARVGRIVRNLISNAIKFTDHGSIKVRTDRDGDFARLTVADTGVGIAPELLKTVFDADDLAGSGPVPSPNTGLGVGLPLVRELVAAHDGRIVAQSDGAERGASFTVWIRLAEVPQAPLVEAAAGADNPLQGLRIVLVDDSVDLLTAVAALLAFEGAHVESFETGEAALDRLLKGDVDLLISDLGMPGMDGYELIAQVRKQPPLASLPAIALTGYGRTRDPGHAVRAGFNAHTTKPVALEELKSIVSLLRSL